MLIDLEQDAGASDALKADVVIVGAGAVGLCMAVTLAQRGIDVLVLEGGGAQLQSASQALHSGESVGHPFESIGVGRYRVLGGSTTYWGGQVIAFDEAVTGERPWAGHAAWPMPADELARYVDQAYTLLGLGEAVRDDAAVWPLLGLESPDLGPEADVVLTRWVRVRNLARHFARQIKSLPTLRVALHANVVGLALSADRRHVEGLELRTLAGRSFRASGRHVVLANGTLEIARLLQHPLADGSAAPWADSAWLGRPLIDHLDCRAGQVRVLDHERFHQAFDMVYSGGYRYYPKMRLPVAVQRAQGLYDCGAAFLYRTRFTEHLEVLKMFLRSVREGGVPASAWQVPRHLAAVLGTAFPLALRYFRDHRSFKPKDAEVSLALYCEQAPCKDSRIELGPDVDALGMRRLRVHWAIDGRELRTMKVFAEGIAGTLARHGLAQVRVDPRLLDESPEFVSGINDAVHHMGATRIGPDRDNGFVDRDLSVFDIDNLSIAGATVFPSSGFANPTLTAIALALRLSDHIGAVRG